MGETCELQARFRDEGAPCDLAEAGGRGGREDLWEEPRTEIEI